MIIMNYMSFSRNKSSSQQKPILLLLLVFVIAWIAPTFGLFISSLRDKDVLAISGWWTSFTTIEVNEIYRTKKGKINN